jgi:hypothetical protein
MVQKRTLAGAIVVAAAAAAATAAAAAAPPAAYVMGVHGAPAARRGGVTAVGVAAGAGTSGQQARFRLAVGNKCYSSWSLRAWLAVRLVAARTGFEEVLCPLAGAGAPAVERAEASARILPFSPSGQLPALLDRQIGETIHESLAIILHLALEFPESHLLPNEPHARARVLWACAEMHGKKSEKWDD